MVGMVIGYGVWQPKPSQIVINPFLTDEGLEVGCPDEDAALAANPRYIDECGGAKADLTLLDESAHLL